MIFWFAKKYLTLLVLALIVVVTFVVASLPARKPIVVNQKLLDFQGSALPVLKNATFPVLTSRGVLAIDLDSAVSLYEKEPDAALLPASTTKIMTALIAYDYYPMNTVLSVSGVKIEGQKMGLSIGEKISVENLLDGLLIYSANDAAEVLAGSYPGGRDAFVKAMNLKAKELHLAKTEFKNPTGLDDYGHRSSARDILHLAQIAMQNPKLSQIVATENKTVKSVDGGRVHNLRNINELLGKVPGVLGVKTGWTTEARENLVTYIERDGHKVMIAMLGSQDRFGETKELIEWIFSSYTWTDVATLRNTRL